MGGAGKQERRGTRASRRGEGGRGGIGRGSEERKKWQDGRSGHTVREGRLVDAEGQEIGRNGERARNSGTSESGNVGGELGMGVTMR